MDDDKTASLIETSSCRNLGWIFDLCREHGIDQKSILRNLPNDMAHLADPANFVSWECMATLHNNLSNYLSEKELFEAARLSFSTRGFRVYRVLGLLLYNLSEQLIATFSPHGHLARLYPCQFSILNQNPGHLYIELVMDAHCTPSRSFQVVLAGQIRGLAESMGHSHIDVQTQHSATGARYEITFKHKKSLLATVKGYLTRPTVIRDTAVELNLTHNNLIDAYWTSETQRQISHRLERSYDSLAHQYKLVSTSSSEMIWTAELNKGFTYISPSIIPLLGYTAPEMISRSQDILFSPGFSQQVSQCMATQYGENQISIPGTQGPTQALTGFESPGFLDRGNPFEQALLHKNGKTIWTRTTVNFTHADNSERVEITGVTKDISNERMLEQKLAMSESNYHAITNHADEGIIIVTERNFITFANPATSRIFGYTNSELLGMGLGDLLPEFHSENVQVDETSIKGVKKDGSPILLELSFTDQHLEGQNLTTGIIRDVTARNRVTAEREALQEQLLAAQKMESIGELTGGIAHDFNNLLVAINGFAELSQLATTTPEQRDKFLNQIRRAGNRAAEMTHKLLAFSRRQIIESRVINLNTLVTDLDLMIRRLLPEYIDVHIHRSLEDVHVFADSGQLEQIIVNLAVNAKDAMPDQGRLEISVRNQKIDQAFAADHPTARAGEFALITVQDSGSGMTQDTMEKIFEPFFTTKPEGAGTGLGLSVVAGIVSQHNGFIDVTSNSTEGTCFRIFLPATEAGIDSDLSRPVIPATGGNETLLLVEDNEHVRDLARLILKGAGYTVMEAVDGADAIRQFRNAYKKINLVILDVVMPKMGGREVMSLMREVDPLVKILFTSGYANQGIHTHFILEQGLEFIQKPYSTNSLRAKIRQTLDAEPTSIS